jgi:hypothetical protein
MNIATGKLEAPVVKQAGMLEAITEGAAGLLKHKGLLGASAPVDSYALSAGLGTGASELVHRLGGRRFYGSANKRRMGKALELLAAGSVGGASGVAGALTAPAMTNIRYRTAPTAARDLAQWTGLGMGGEYVSRPFMELATGTGSGTVQTLKNLAAGTAAGSVGLAIKDKKELARQVSKALKAGKAGTDVPSRTLIQGIKRQLGMKAGLPQGTLPGLAGLGLIAGGSPILGTSTLLSAPMFNKDVSKYVGELTEELLKKKKTKDTLDELYKKSSINTTALAAPVYVTMPYCLDAPTTEKVAIFNWLGKQTVKRFGAGLGTGGKAVRQLSRNWQNVSRGSGADLTRAAVEQQSRVAPGANIVNPKFMEQQQALSEAAPELFNFSKHKGKGFRQGTKDWFLENTQGRFRRGQMEAGEMYTPQFTATDDVVKNVNQRMNTRAGRQDVLKDVSNVGEQRAAAPGLEGAAGQESATWTQAGQKSYTGQARNQASHRLRQLDRNAYDYSQSATTAEARYNELLKKETDWANRRTVRGRHPAGYVVPAQPTATETAELAELRRFATGPNQRNSANANVFKTDRYESAQEALRLRSGSERGIERTRQAVQEASGNLTRSGEGAGVRSRNMAEQGEAFGLETGGAGEAGLGAVAGSQLIPFVEPTTAALAGGAMATPSILRGTRRIFDGNNIERLRGVLKGRAFRGDNAKHLETSVLGEGTLAQLEHMQGAGAGGGALRRGVDETIKKVSDSAGLTRTSSKLRGSVESALASNTQLTDSSRQAIIRSYEQGVAQHGPGLTPDQFRKILATNTGYSTSQTATKIPGLKTIEQTLVNNQGVQTAAADLNKSVGLYQGEMKALVQGQLKKRTAAGREALITNTQKASEQPLISGHKPAEAALGRIQRITNQLVETGAEQGSVIGDQALQTVNKALSTKNLRPEEVIALEASLKEMLQQGSTRINIPGRNSILPWRNVDRASVELNLNQTVNSSAVKDALEPVINLKGTQKFDPTKVMNIEALTETGVGTNVGRQAFVDAGGTATNTLTQLETLAGTGEAGTQLSNRILSGKISNAAELTQVELQSLGAEIPQYTGPHREVGNYVDEVLRGNKSVEKGLESLRGQLRRRPNPAQTRDISKAITHIENGLKGVNSGQKTNPDAVLSAMRSDVTKARKAAETASRRKGTIDTKLVKIEMKDQHPPLSKEQLKELAPGDIAAYNTTRLEGVADSIIASNPSVANDPLRILDEMVTLGAVKPYEKKEVLNQLRRMTQPELEAAGGPSKAMSTIIGGIGVVGATGYAASKGGKGGTVTKAKQQAAKAAPVATASWGLSPLQAPVVYRKKLASALVPPIQVKEPKLPKPEKVQPGHSMYTSTAEGANEATRRMKASSLLSAPVGY